LAWQLNNFNLEVNSLASGQMVPGSQLHGCDDYQ
jgi:hypothetical protein